ncbi:MAG: PaaI family thioesterase [Acetobacteraceae bacterium]|nr:PaaI family thioesterase [Acetobacteraceae bacterium]
MRGESTTDDIYWRRVEESFRGQGVMSFLGVRLTHVARGETTVEVPYRPELSQQLGNFQGGVIACVMDVACGFAALTCMDPGHDVVTAEFKMNFLAPARPGLLVARGKVVRAGRLLTVSTAEGWVDETQVALMQATMAAVRRR